MADIDIPQFANPIADVIGVVAGNHWNRGARAQFEAIFRSAGGCASTMAKFEDLPENVRALILAKLAAELAAHKSVNLYQLAKLQGTGLTHAWRDICRKAGQPVCTIPAELTQGR